MVVSNEPGYYKGGEGGFGVRIENLLEIVDSGMTKDALGRRCDVCQLLNLSLGCKREGSAVVHGMN